jgi:hypothetical protein
MSDKWLAVTTVGIVALLMMMIASLFYSGAQEYKACIQNNSPKACENVGS